jgi:hypothetical protein
MPSYAFGIAYNNRTGKYIRYRQNIILEGDTCRNGGRVSHTEADDRQDFLRFLPRAECGLCRKYKTDEAPRTKTWPQCIDPLCTEPFAPCLKQTDHSKYLDWENGHDCWLDRQEPQAKQMYLASLIPLPEDKEVTVQRARGVLGNQRAKDMLAAIRARNEVVAADSKDHNQQMKEAFEKNKKDQLTRKRELQKQGRPQNRLLQKSRFRTSQQKVRKVIHEVASRAPSTPVEDPTVVEQNPVLDAESEIELANMASETQEHLEE